MLITFQSWQLSWGGCLHSELCLQASYEKSSRSPTRSSPPPLTFFLICFLILLLNTRESVWHQLYFWQSFNPPFSLNQLLVSFPSLQMMLASVGLKFPLDQTSAHHHSALAIMGPLAMASVAGGTCKTLQLSLKATGGVVCLFLILFILISSNGKKRLQPPLGALGNHSRLYSGFAMYLGVPIEVPWRRICSWHV